MTTILAVETTSEFCCVALYYQNTRSYLYSDVKNSHADMLLALVNRLLENAGLELKQVDAIGLVVGPGSFTGIRIGLSMVQGLAYGLNMPVVCINKLELLAQTALTHKSLDSSRAILVATDANMGDVFWQSFDVAIDKVLGVTHLQLKNEPKATKIDTAQTHFNNDHIYSNYIGDAFTKGKLVLNEGNAIEVTLDNICESLLVLTQQKLDAGAGVSAFNIEPLYVRTEITWKKRERIRETH